MKIYNPLISVIIPIYMAENFLHRCVDSVINQTYKNLEIILINDGSKDKSGIICDEYAKKDTRIKVIHQENQGVSAARNKGLDIAKGEFIYFLDSDDYISLNALEKLINVQKEENYNIVASGHYSVHGNKYIVKSKNWEKKSTDFEIIRKKILLNKYPNFCAGKLFRKKLWNNLRFPIGIISEDMYACARFFMIAKSACVISDPLYFYTAENVNSLANGANISSLVNSKYGNFFAWKDRENLAQKYMTSFLKICRNSVTINAVRALIMNYHTHIIEQKKCDEMITYLKENKDVKLPFAKNFQRNIILNNNKICLNFFGFLNKYVLLLRTFLRRKKFERINKK